MEVNKNIIFRKEFDGSGLLFNPETGKTFGLNPTSVFLWEQFAAGKNEAEALAALQQVCAKIPADAQKLIAAFTASLKEKKFII